MFTEKDWWNMAHDTLNTLKSIRDELKVKNALEVVRYYQQGYVDVTRIHDLIEFSEQEEKAVIEAKEMLKYVPLPALCIRCNTPFDTTAVCVEFHEEAEGEEASIRHLIVHQRCVVAEDEVIATSA